MKAYIAAPWEFKAEAREIRDHLDALGVESTASWIDIEGSRFEEDQSSGALRDMADLRGADMLIVYIPDPDTSCGGLHSELGMALWDRYPVVVIGNRDNIFTHHPDVRHFESIEDWQAHRSILRD